MPILIVNMGGEMVYILEQRLHAQKIPEQKGHKVLNDVVRTMYYPRFIEELFKPQEMYSIQSTRQIFDRLAHSSIMRLNESSMDKLFDLMAMGFKYQMISCTRPSEMIDVTLNHLEALRRLVGDAAQPGVAELLDVCVQQMHAAYDNMSLADLSAMRHSLCAFFQDRKVKVSLFLHDRTQNQDGSIVVPHSGELAPDALVPGTIVYFQGGQEVRRVGLPTISSSTWRHGTGQRTSLGANLYEKDRQQQQVGAPGGAAASASGQAAPPPQASAAAAVGELNLLASLIGTQTAVQGETFKLESLFGANVFEKGGAAGGADIIQIDGTKGSQHREGLDAIRAQMEGLSVDAGAAGGQDDLLDLMDRA